eukprot:3451076-Pyramimonas_sp.AAC.1
MLVAVAMLMTTRACGGQAESRGSWRNEETRGDACSVHKRIERHWMAGNSAGPRVQANVWGTSRV